MPRKRKALKAAYIQPKIRLPLELHAQLKQAAEKNRVPLNREILNRLLESFDMRPHRSLEHLYVNYENLLLRLERWERATRGENKS